MERNQYYIFINSLFFVLGFSIVFSLVGILLQTILSNSSLIVLKWLSRAGGIIIIIFVRFCFCSWVDSLHRCCFRIYFNFGCNTTNKGIFTVVFLFIGIRNSFSFSWIIHKSGK